MNLDEVRKLVADLERDLAKVQSGSADVQALRSEVDALKKALASPEPAHGRVSEALSNLHAKVDAAAETAKADAVKIAPYITSIGRILGLS